MRLVSSALRKSRSVAMVFSAFLLLGAERARADGLADEAELQFQLGAADYKKGQWTGALEHFMLSNRIVPNRRVVFNIARTFEQLEAWPDAYRYYVDARAGETDAAALEAIDNALKKLTPNVALLDVVTDPPGATIYIDRRDLGSRGKAPRPLAVTPGRYRVIAELEGYEPASRDEVVAERGKQTPVSLALKRIVGKVKVSLSGAPKALVRVDDDTSPPACTAPCELTLSVGKHELHIAAEGVAAPTRAVNVIAGQTVEVNVALKPPTGTLVVGTVEPGALVTIDDRPAGFTPVVIREVAVGKRRVRVSRPGQEPIEREIVIKQGEQSDLGMLDLAPQREVTAASRYSEQIDDAPSSVTIIDRREIAAFGYPTIAEALRGSRGITLSNDRAYASVQVRGVGQPNDYGNRLLVLSDGQPLNDNLLNSSYIGSDGRGDLEDVDRIEIIRGPGSLLYGTGAFSGLVNLVTRGREESEGVHFGLGSYDDSVLRARGGFHLKLDKNRGIWMSGWGAQSDGTDLEIPIRGQTEKAQGVDAFRAGGTAGRMYYGPATLQWFFHERTQSIPVGAYRTTFDDPGTAFTDARFMIEGRYEPRLSNSLQVLLRAHANRYVFRANYRFEDGSDNLEELAGTWLGAEARLVYSPGSRLRLTIGGEGQWHPEAMLAGHTEEPGQPPTKYLGVNRSYGFAAGYALAEGAPFSWLRLSGGVRIDAYSTFGVVAVPRGAAIIRPVRGGVLKIMGGGGFRAPSIYEQVYNDNKMSQEQALSLDPEKIFSGEIEYTQRFLDDWAALGAVHASRIDDLIDTVSIPKKNTVRYANSPESVLVFGADAEIRREWRRGFMLSGTYGFQRAVYDDSASPDPRLPNVPAHLASFRAVIPALPPIISAALRVTLEAPRPLSGGGSTGTNVIADATLSGEVRALGIRYVMGIYNLADRRYSVPVTDTFQSRVMPQNGRTFLVSLVATYP